MRFTRREILELAAKGTLLPALSVVAGCGDDDPEHGTGLVEYRYAGPPGPETLFEHGVASGDPLPDAVIVWTRLSPSVASDVDVYWEIGLDAQLRSRVGAGWTVARAAADYSVKLDVTNLQPGTTYYYRFRALDRISRTGRTRTAPSGRVDHLRFAVASCSNYSAGYFHGYRRIAERDVDAVIHLGDYIYEGGGGAVRSVEPPREIISLQDYRTRYAHYRKDLDLQAAHARHPFITVWDDHESANNSWREGAENHQPQTEGPWSERRAAALQAYSEWMPIRTDDPARIFRALGFGDLIDLVMLDTRLWGRDEQVVNPAHPIIRDPNRSLLGSDQEAWLFEQLRNSRSHWRFIGQQVVFAHLKTVGLPNSAGGGRPLNPDQWDGYVAARQRVLDVLRDDDIGNVIILTGDIHASGVAEVAEDPNNPAAYDRETGAGSLAVELVTPGITSLGISGGNEILLPRLFQQNPHLKYADLEHRGYLVVDVTRERVHADWFHFEEVEQPQAEESFARAFVVTSGSNYASERDAPLGE